MISDCQKSLADDKTGIKTVQQENAENLFQIGLIQADVKPELSDTLKAVLESIDACAKAGASIAVLPELWNTPFINEKIKEHVDDAPMLLKALCQAARDYQIWIISGTFPVRENSKIFNRAYMINPKGEVETFCDKMHLLEVHARHVYRESDVFDPGSSLCTFQIGSIKCACCICYDIRFCELARLLCKDADLLFVCAGFNEAVGKKHWKLLLQTRAMENQVFVIGVNPAARDFGTYRSYGHSLIADPDGTCVLEMDGNTPWAVTGIDLCQVGKIRSRSPFWKLRRTDLYELKLHES